MLQTIHQNSHLCYLIMFAKLLLWIIFCKATFVISWARVLLWFFYARIFKVCPFQTDFIYSVNYTEAECSFLQCQEKYTLLYFDNPGKRKRGDLVSLCVSANTGICVLMAPHIQGLLLVSCWEYSIFYSASFNPDNSIWHIEGYLDLGKFLSFNQGFKIS